MDRCGRNSARSGGGGDCEWHCEKSVRGGSTACARVYENAGACAFQNRVAGNLVVAGCPSTTHIQMDARLGAVEDDVAGNYIVACAYIDGIKSRRAKDFIASNKNSIPKSARHIGLQCYGDITVAHYIAGDRDGAILLHVEQQNVRRTVRCRNIKLFDHSIVLDRSPRATKSNLDTVLGNIANRAGSLNVVAGRSQGGAGITRHDSVL